MYTVDIHKYKETIKEAIYELDVAIDFGKREKDHLVKVITGYGSTGGTHKIKTNVLEYLKDKKNKGIKDFIISSDLVNHTGNFFEFKYLSIIPDDEKRSGNPGVIFIVV